MFRKKGQSKLSCVSKVMESRLWKQEWKKLRKRICNKGFTLCHNSVEFLPTLPSKEPLTNFAVLELESSKGVLRGAMVQLRTQGCKSGNPSGKV